RRQSVNERILAGSWRVPCTIRDATAIARQSVCGQLKKHANLITANFTSLWPPRGSRSPVRMRQAVADLFDRFAEIANRREGAADMGGQLLAAAIVKVDRRKG